MGFLSGVSKGFKSVGKAISGGVSDVGEALFGTETAKEAQEQASKAAAGTASVGAQAKAFGQQYAPQGTAYDKGTAESMGANAGEYMQKAQAAAGQQAEQAGQTAATQGTQAALRAARSSGLSKGQAALASGQQAGDLYTNTYGQQLQQGIQNYGNATQQFAGQGNEMYTRQQNALNTQLGAATGQANIAQNQATNAAQKSAQTWGTVGTLAGAGALLALSDENAKTNIQDTGLKTNDTKKSKVLTTDEIKQNLMDYTKSGLAQQSSFGQGLASGAQLGSVLSQLKDKYLTKPDAGTTASLATPSASTIPSATPAAGAGVTSELGKAGLTKGLLALSDKKAKISIDDLRSKVNNLDVSAIAKKIHPVKFEYKKEIIDQGKANPGEHLGVLAQDVEKAIPNVVKTGDDGLKRIDTSELSMALLNMLTQLTQKVDKLEDSKGEAKNNG